MKSLPAEELDALWARHHAEWRDPAQITSQWDEAAALDPKLLRYRVTGDWWGILAECKCALLVTREYEHLVMAMHLADGKPEISYMKMPHPSGIAVDHQASVVHIASTRNPNQVYDLMPVTGLMPRGDAAETEHKTRPLVPVRSRFFPGCFYMHELALIGGELYANSVGQNAVVRLDADGSSERVWYPRCIETESGPVFEQNHIQLNSIAAGESLKTSFFSASTDKMSQRRPGHKNFPVDGRGVIFSGETREPIAYGLTRPHSARLYRSRIWVDNSGYGELCIVENGAVTAIAKLPGWTRGLCFHGDIAFVGTSRVIPRFRQYAPGLEVDRTICGVHAVDIQSGKILGSLTWMYGNQIFAIELASWDMTTGFPFNAASRRATVHEKSLFYAFKTDIEPRKKNKKRSGK